MCQLEQNRKLASTFPGLVYNQLKKSITTTKKKLLILDIPLFAKPSLIWDDAIMQIPIHLDRD